MARQQTKSEGYYFTLQYITLCFYAVPYWFLFEHAVKAVAKQGLPRRTFIDAIKEEDKRTR